MKDMNRIITHLLLFCFFANQIYAMEETENNQLTEIEIKKLLYSLQSCGEKEAFKINKSLPNPFRTLFKNTRRRSYTNQSGKPIDANNILSHIFINSIEQCAAEKQASSQHYKCVHAKINEELESLKSSANGSATREEVHIIYGDDCGLHSSRHTKKVFLYDEIKKDLISALHDSITFFDDWEKVWPILLKKAHIQAKINLNYSDYRNNRTRCSILTEALRQPNCIDGKKEISTRQLLTNKLDTILKKCSTGDCLTKMLKEAHDEAEKTSKEYSEYGFACRYIYDDYISTLKTIGFEPGKLSEKEYREDLEWLVKCLKNRNCPPLIEPEISGEYRFEL